MPSSYRILAVVLALAGCSVEHGNKPPAAAGNQPQGMTGQGGVTPGPLHQVFAHTRDTVVMGVERMSVSVMLAPETDRTAQRATMQAVLDGERHADSTLAAIRVLGFFPPSAGHGAHPGGMAMVPSAILEWVPSGGAGWNGVTAANARGPHATDALFVSDLPAHPRLPAPGAGR